MSVGQVQGTCSSGLTCPASPATPANAVPAIGTCPAGSVCCGGVNGASKPTLEVLSSNSFRSALLCRSSYKWILFRCIVVPIYWGLINYSWSSSWNMWIDSSMLWCSQTSIRQINYETRRARFFIVVNYFRVLLLVFQHIIILSVLSESVDHGFRLFSIK